MAIHTNSKRSLAYTQNESRLADFSDSIGLKLRLNNIK